MAEGMSNIKFTSVPIDANFVTPKSKTAKPDMGKPITAMPVDIKELQSKYPRGAVTNFVKNVLTEFSNKTGCNLNWVDVEIPEDKPV